MLALELLDGQRPVTQEQAQGIAGARPRGGGGEDSREEQAAAADDDDWENW